MYFPPIPQSDALIRGNEVVIGWPAEVFSGVMVTDVPWLSVSGFGAHIKSTQTKLIIQKKSRVDEYPLGTVKNLLIIGGHTLNSATVMQLINNGAFISFFQPDGSPVGVIRPFGDHSEEQMREIQRTLPRHRYAILIAQGSIRARLLAIQRSAEKSGRTLLYEGESQFLHAAYDELEYLIKLEEIRRLHRLTSDMYYEIMSRSLIPELGFRRRTRRPHHDPVNAMLSFGYSMLFGNCSAPILGARLDMDLGVLHEGKCALVYDLIEPFKAEMIDAPVFQISADIVGSDDFECTASRCILSEELMRKLIKVFQVTINHKKIEEQVLLLTQAIQNRGEFRILY